MVKGNRFPKHSFLPSFLPFLPYFFPPGSFRLGFPLGFISWYVPHGIPSRCFPADDLRD